MKPTQVPRILEILNQVWFFFALLLLLTFTMEITGFTAEAYGALPAAITFGALTLMVLYAILWATRRPSDGQSKY